MTNSNFDEAVKVVLANEGGFSDDVDDPGGQTNFGITQRDLDQYSKALHLPPQVKQLTVDDAKQFYFKLYWEEYHYDAINSLTIATKVFDMAVNMGATQAHKLVQTALQWNGYGNLKIDSILGPITIGAINEMTLHGRDDDLHNELCEEATHYYTVICEDNPKLYKFLNGWLRRAEE